MSRALCWIRRDLRLRDHSPLHLACSQFDEVAVVFVFDSNILKDLKNPRDRRVTFIMESLRELDLGLRRHGSSLIVLFGDPIQEIPKLATALGVTSVVTSNDFEPYALNRDRSVKLALEQENISFRSLKDQVIFEKGEVLSQSLAPFRVFTPFSRRWLENFRPEIHADERNPNVSKLMPSNLIEKYSIGLEYDVIGFSHCELWLPAGEREAILALTQFESKIDQYGESRDIPSIDGTSFLSVHLRFGTVSIRETVRVALRHDSAGAKKWLVELIWRDFYQDILASHPHVVHSPFNNDYKDLRWPGELDHFEAWKAGVTGYPIVDAAMRCFAETGWMHNRLRMIVASFLTKDLLLDYRLGEEYFAQNLLDFDLASNNGGWQWAASVGCDAQPYFRIFNPTLQSQKFDPQGKFIRRWIPEISSLDNQGIHQPSALESDMLGYVAPIVDHKLQRQKAISLFSKAKNNPNSH